MLKKFKKRILLALPMLIVMFIIFGFSSADGKESGSLSFEIAEWVSETLGSIGIKVSAINLHLPIRKLAHMSEYTLLFISAMWAFTGVRKRYLWAFGISVLFAVSDEIHQLFVPGRAGSVIDVLIDSVGIFIGMMFFCIFSKQNILILFRKTPIE